MKNNFLGLEWLRNFQKRKFLDRKIRTNSGCDFRCTDFRIKFQKFKNSKLIIPLDNA